MDIKENWENALKNTEIVRSHAKPLKTFEDTELPYILLSKSLVNRGDTVMRKGKVLVSRPSLLSPNQLPQLDGFDFEKDMGISEDSILNFFLVRGIRYPSLKYSNEPYALDVIEKGLNEARKKMRQRSTTQRRSSNKSHPRPGRYVAVLGADLRAGHDSPRRR